jgi:hypothetical protein
LEKSNIPLFIENAIALKDNAALEFARGMAERKLASLLNADFENASNVRFLIVATCFVSNIGPLTHLGFVPAARLPQSSLFF